MDNDMLVPMLNRGEIRWVPFSEVDNRLKIGWEKWELPEPPKESYYPQYDRSRFERQGDERIAVPGSEDEVKERLGLVAI